VSKLVLFNKPFNVLSQFTDDKGRKTLSDYIDIKAVYAAGRLDYDSEGLLLLTDDGQLQAQISSPKFKLNKTYWVQVEGQVTVADCDKLLAGVELKDGMATAVACRSIDEPALWPRVPPIRQRQTVSDSWMEIVINEGRNRQVRRMTAAVGLPTLRLVRAAIGDWTLDNIELGEYRLETVHLPASKTTAKRPSSRPKSKPKPPKNSRRRT
jgi:23S rRNA pseudouridine2457 synthase|tara:strand:- start:1138 stop:1767 length:630 start_codon:yes stop_codon:yes gene_type:complete